MDPKWRLSHARGYLGLGMFRHALRELAALPPNAANAPEAVALRVAALQGAEKWEPLRRLAGHLAAKEPDRAEWWVVWAYATRRAIDLAAAEQILQWALERHPRHATILYNLGCYACQRGDLDEARRRVGRAIELDEGLRRLARSDPDLAPLRQADPGFLRMDD